MFIHYPSNLNKGWLSLLWRHLDREVVWASKVSLSGNNIMMSWIKILHSFTQLNTNNHKVPSEILYPMPPCFRNMPHAYQYGTIYLFIYGFSLFLCSGKTLSEHLRTHLHTSEHTCTPQNTLAHTCTHQNTLAHTCTHQNILAHIRTHLHTLRLYMHTFRTHTLRPRTPEHTAHTLRMP